MQLKKNLSMVICVALLGGCLGMGTFSDKAYAQINTAISETDCDFFDAVYIPHPSYKKLEDYNFKLFFKKPDEDKVTFNTRYTFDFNLYKDGKTSPLSSLELTYVCAQGVGGCHAIGINQKPDEGKAKEISFSPVMLRNDFSQYYSEKYAPYVIVFPHTTQEFYYKLGTMQNVNLMKKRINADYVKYYKEDALSPVFGGDDIWQYSGCKTSTD